jgi:hypothetical protein
MIACGKCGYRNQDGAEFCASPGCGAYLGYVGQKVAPPPGDVLLTLSPALVGVQPGGEAQGEERDGEHGASVVAARLRGKTTPGSLPCRRLTAP